MVPGLTGQATPEMVIVRRELDRLQNLPVDQAVLQRHESNLARLSNRLRGLGMRDVEVASHVLGIFCEFESAVAGAVLKEPSHA